MLRAWTSAKAASLNKVQFSSGVVLIGRETCRCSACYHNNCHVIVKMKILQECLVWVHTGSTLSEAKQNLLHPFSTDMHDMYGL